VSDHNFLTPGDESLAGLSMLLPKGVARFDGLHDMSHGGNNLLSEIPIGRWDSNRAATYLTEMPSAVQSRVRYGAFLHNAELFDPGFFSISGAEAAAMDPQQRLLLERGYSAFHCSGETKATLMGTVTAVNVGQWASEYTTVLLSTPMARSVYAATASTCSVTCGRVSFALGLQGPCSSYDTACSASLVANNGSMRALQRFECETALSAGVNMVLDANTMLGNATAGFTSSRAGRTPLTRGQMAMLVARLSMLLCAGGVVMSR
jgi:acyl transferase domain-containing protein